MKTISSGGCFRFMVSRVMSERRGLGTVAEHLELVRQKSVSIERFEGDVKRVHNFSAGPATLPVEVLLRAKKDMLSYEGTGCGFMELSHRDAGGPVQRLMVETQDLVRHLLDVPNNYQILFMPGGAHLQFSAVPLNLCKNKDSSVGFVDTGFWSQRAASHASKYVHTETVCNNKGILQPFTKWEDNLLANEYEYVHMCMNETIAGLEYLEDPSFVSSDLNKRHTSGKLNIICDATSTLLSRRVDVSKYGILFASSGKNFGPAGVTTIIIRDDLIPSENEIKHTLRDILPEMMDYRLQAYSQPVQNIYNTPPTYNLYFQNLILKHYIERGGLEYYEDKAIRLAKTVYEFLDNSRLYATLVDPMNRRSRSRMNVCFGVNHTQRAVRDRVEKDIMKEGEKAGVFQLLGHPLFGGLRVTLYNGVEEDSVMHLLEFLYRFEKQYEYNLGV